MVEAKPQWQNVPLDLVKQIEAIIDDQIISGDICWGGYSASASFHVKTASGTSYFVKGSHDQEMAHGAKILAQEIDFYQNWSLLKEKGPKFLGSAHQEDEDGWHLGVWEYLPEAKQVSVETEEDIEKLCRAIGAYHFNVKQRPAFAPKMAETQFVRNFLDTDLLWPRIYYKEEVRKEFLAAFQNPEQTQDWLIDSYPALIKALSRIQYIEKNAEKRQAMLHFDLRLDNIVSSRDDIYVIDWPNLCWGPALFDIVHLSAYISAHTSYSASQICRIYQYCHSVSYKPEDILAVIASLSGYYGQHFYKSAPEAMPRLRQMQKQIFTSLLDWFAHETAINPLPALKS